MNEFFDLYVKSLLWARAESKRFPENKILQHREIRELINLLRVVCDYNIAAEYQPEEIDFIYNTENKIVSLIMVKKKPLDKKKM